MKIIKKVFSVLLSIIVFIITTILSIQLMINTFINSGTIEGVFDKLIDEIKEQSFSEDNTVIDGEKESTLILKKYDDDGNYIGDYEVDISMVDFRSIINVIEEYFDQVLDYIKNYDENSGEIYLDSTKLINPIINEYEKVIRDIEIKENINLDRSELNNEITESINEIFNDLNKGLNKGLNKDIRNEAGSFISFFKTFIVNKGLIIGLIILDLVLCGLIILINQSIYSVFYIVVPFGLSSGLLLSILRIFGLSKSTLLLFLIGVIPLLIAIGLVIMFYFVKRNNQ